MKTNVVQFLMPEADVSRLLIVSIPLPFCSASVGLFRGSYSVFGVIGILEEEGVVDAMIDVETFQVLAGA